MVKYLHYESADTRYAYAVGKVRALEVRLLEKKTIEMMIEAAGSAECLRLLEGVSAYDEELAHITSPDEYELFIERELGKTFKFIRNLSFEPEITDLFLLNYDFHNLKMLLKAKISGLTVEPYIYDIGVVHKRTLGDVVKGEEPGRKGYQFPYADEILEATELAWSAFEKNRDPELLDIVLDNYFYELSHRTLKASGHLFLYNYMLNSADIANVRTLIRAKAAGRDEEFLQGALLPGLLKRERFVKIFAQPLSAYPGRFANTDYAEVVKGGVEGYETKGSFDKLDKLADNFLINFIKRAKLFTFGIEPLVGFIIGKENEAAQIRMIMSGKLNDLSQDEIRTRVRESYV